MENVDWTYEGGTKKAIRNINLKIKKGEIAIITGPSGAGKSTLCYCMSGLIPHFFRGELRGEVTVGGYNVKQTSLKALSKEVGICFDNPSNQLFCATVLEEVAFGPENICASRDEVIERVREAIKFCRLEEYRDKSPHALSGGLKQSTAIAAILAMRPNIFILDEPTSNLDPEGTELIFHRIRELVNTQNKTTIIVEHKLEYVLPFADRLIIMSDGEIIANGPVRKVLAESELLERLEISVPHVTKLAYRICKHLAEDNIPITLEEGIKLLREITMKKTIPTPKEHKSHSLAEKERRIIIKCEDVWYEYPDRTLALKGINLEIEAGKLIGIIGQNGSGKTTLAKLFNGLYKPTKGVVIVDGIDTRTVDVGYLARIVGYCFQNPDDQIFAKTVKEEIEFGPRNLKLPPEEVEQRVKKYAKKLEIYDYLDASPFTLSQGLRQRVAVASILTMEPKILIIDEPTTGQDYARSKAVMELAKALNEEGKTVIIISHDMNLVAEYCDRVVVMWNGKILIEGTTREVFSKPQVLAQSSLKPPQITQLAQRLGFPPDILTVDEMIDLLDIRG
jgi:energy-coupling factor transport system ATP-binding protein